MAQVSPQAAQRYAAAVVRVLAGDFRDLTDQHIRQIVAENVARQAEAPLASFEVIVDNPISANWRLKADGQDQRRVRLACYRMNPAADDRERERRINTALQTIEL